MGRIRKFPIVKTFNSRLSKYSQKEIDNKTHDINVKHLILCVFLLLKF